MPKSKLLVLSSGGDAPGMNAAIRGVVRTALHYDLDVYGVESGYSGLLEQKLMPLYENSVANIIQRGGTVLKTGRCVEFQKEHNRQKAAQFLQKQGIDYLVVLGGDGSFRGATLLQQAGGPPCIGIPCTIDNDINGTEYCIGFSTACNTALDAIDKIRDTAYSLERKFIIEVMGRASGFLAVKVGIAGGAEIILTPEFPMELDDIIAQIKAKKREKLTSIIIAAEANQPGRSIKIAEDIKERSGIDYKVCILGHTQRGGTPSAHDRKVGSIMGVKAVQALLEGQSGKMTAMLQGSIQLADFPTPENGTRFFANRELLEMNSMICE